MEYRHAMSETYVEVALSVPVPRGHEVTVVALRGHPSARELAWVVIDRTSGVVHVSEALWEPLGDSLAAAVGPVAALTRWSWTVERTVCGKVVACMVGTSDTGDSNFAKTRLHVEPLPASPGR